MVEQLFTFIFMILFVASIISLLLNKLMPASNTLKNVQTIIKSWWIIVIVLFLFFLFGKTGILILFYLITSYSLIEYTKLTRLTHLAKKLQIAFLSVNTLVYGSLFFESEVSFFLSVFVYLSVAMPAFMLIHGVPADLPRVISVQVGAMLPNFFMSFIPAIAIFHSRLGLREEQASVLVVILLLAIGSNDVFQFISGKLFGKKKAIQAVSPNKTREGFIGGLIGSALLFSFLTFHFALISIPYGILGGLLISAMGIMGDLLYSCMKRYYGVKDFGTLIPGHGGLLDRIDSLSLVGPVFVCFIYLLKVAPI